MIVSLGELELTILVKPELRHNQHNPGPRQRHHDRRWFGS